MLLRKKDSGLALVLAALGFLVFIAVIVTTIAATVGLGRAYGALRGAGAGSAVMLNYNDHLLARLGFGMELAADAANSQTTLAAFGEAALRAIQARMLAVFLIYAAMAVMPLTLIFTMVPNNRPWTPARATPIIIDLAYAVFVVVAIVSALACGIPFYFPKGGALSSLLVALISVRAGCFALALLVNASPRKAPMAIIVLLALAPLFALSYCCGFGIFGDPNATPASLVNPAGTYMLGQDFPGGFCFDQLWLALAQGSDAGTFRLLSLPVAVTGAARNGAILLEVLNPLSGGLLELVRQAPTTEIPVAAGVLYILKALALWYALSAVAKRLEASAGAVDKPVPEEAPAGTADAADAADEPALPDSDQPGLV